MNRTILSALLATTDDERHWDDAISRVRWGINSSQSSATGKSPYEVFLGYRPRGVKDAFLTTEVSENERLDLTVVRDNVSQVTAQKQRAQKQLYDSRHARPKTFKIGQQVLRQSVKTANDGRSRKLEPRYKGPFLITEILDHDRYVIEDMPGAKRSRLAYRGICPSDKLKPFETTVSQDEADSSGDDEID